MQASLQTSTIIYPSAIVKTINRNWLPVTSIVTSLKAKNFTAIFVSLIVYGISLLYFVKQYLGIIEC